MLQFAKPGWRRTSGRWLTGIFCLALPLWARAGDTVVSVDPHPAMIAPFVLLLLAMAFMPFFHKHHWENHYPKIALGLGAITLGYYLSLHQAPRILASLVEYAGFIALIGSLFVIAGGIHIKLSGPATPAMNTGLLALGAILANFLGTTGASMLLIRPFLRINKDRVAPYHVVFFLFLVSNLGGALTPIGDPPLFLGYLKGVPFFWLVKQPQVLAAWLLCMGALLAMFFLLDSRHARKSQTVVAKTPRERMGIEGMHNFLFLFLILGLVLVQKAAWLQAFEHWPSIGALGDVLGWGAAKTAESFIAFVAAVLMMIVAGVAYRFSHRDVLRENEFHFGPIQEVAFLFLGIFITMVPALDWLEKHASALGVATPRQFFWASGVLSSLLDNAPTYLNFLSAAFGLQHLSLENPAHMEKFLADPATAAQVVAISLGAVFFGACTYIGNGPNFMVKSIAESSGVKCPSFFGYLFKYALPLLIPLFAIISWLILR